jgi:hypothetical protein
VDAMKLLVHVVKCASPSASAPVDISPELQSGPRESSERRSRTQVRHSKGTPELIWEMH